MTIKQLKVDQVDFYRCYPEERTGENLLSVVCFNDQFYLRYNDLCNLFKLSRMDNDLIYFNIPKDKKIMLIQDLYLIYVSTETLSYFSSHVDCNLFGEVQEMIKAELALLEKIRSKNLLKSQQETKARIVKNYDVKSLNTHTYFVGCDTMATLLLLCLNDNTLYLDFFGLCQCLKLGIDENLDDLDRIYNDCSSGFKVMYKNVCYIRSDRMDILKNYYFEKNPDSYSDLAFNSLYRWISKCIIEDLERENENMDELISEPASITIEESNSDKIVAAIIQAVNICQHSLEDTEALKIYTSYLDTLVNVLDRI